MRTIYLSIFLITILASCNKGINKGSSCESNAGAQVLIHDGEEREYMLYVPSSYDGTTAAPLMFNFHGYGGKASEYMTYADMRTQADANGFILVYPQGACLDGDPHWNAGLPSATNKSTVDDFGFINALIDELAADYVIDSERIYACGYSNGGYFSYALACYHSDKIAAVGSVSGTMLTESKINCSPVHPTSVIVLHGTSDNVVPYNGTEGLESTSSVIDYWIGYNNTDTSPTVVNYTGGGMNVEHQRYANGDSLTAVEHYKVNGGDHVWFDLNISGSNTSQLIWDFVSQYDINGLR